MTFDFKTFDGQLMFETRLQTYWADADAAEQVFFPNFFRFVVFAEEELFRAAGQDMMALFDKYRVVMPRVESFAKFMKPIRVGEAIFIRMQTHFKGEKTVRMEFEMFSAKDRALLAQGYVTAVCVHRRKKVSCALPAPIRAVYAVAN